MNRAERRHLSDLYALFGSSSIILTWKAYEGSWEVSVTDNFGTPRHLATDPTLRYALERAAQAGRRLAVSHARDSG